MKIFYAIYFSVVLSVQVNEFRRNYVVNADRSCIVESLAKKHCVVPKKFVFLSPYVFVATPCVQLVADRRRWMYSAAVLLSLCETAEHWCGNI